MEHRIVANVDGVIGMLKLKPGDQVQQGDVLVEISE
jgi:biotin carboxyl carrier protein